MCGGRGKAEEHPPARASRDPYGEPGGARCAGETFPCSYLWCFSTVVSLHRPVICLSKVFLNVIIIVPGTDPPKKIVAGAIFVISVQSLFRPFINTCKLSSVGSRVEPLGIQFLPRWKLGHPISHLAVFLFSRVSFKIYLPLSQRCLNSYSFSLCHVCSKTFHQSEKVMAFL